MLRRKLCPGVHSSIGALVIAAVVVTQCVVGAVGAGQTATELHLYLVAVGDVPADMMNGLVAHFSARYGVPIKTLTPLGFDRATFDESRRQLVADRVIKAVRSRYPTLAKQPGTRVIAITPDDMYMEAMRDRWVFAFSLRSPDAHFAVVSYARMDPANLGDPPNTDLLRLRLQKMIAKNIGVMYFGLRGSTNPRSALFNNILGVDDLDRMTEDFNPK